MERDDQPRESDHRGLAAAAPGAARGAIICASELCTAGRVLWRKQLHLAYSPPAKLVRRLGIEPRTY